MAKPENDNWFSYEWDVRGTRALFTVDTGYEEPAAGYDTLLYCAIAPRDAQEKEFTPRMERRADKIQKRIVRALPQAKYVGSIDMDALRQLYFYVQDGEAAADAVRDAIRREKLLLVSPGTAQEPDWLSYHALLLPDAAKYQTTLNEEMIERLRRSGDGLTTVRRLTFSLGFPSEQTRLLFQEQARQSGFAIGEPQFRPEMDLPHVLTVHALSALVKHDVDQLTTRAIRVAEPHGGELLRWSCPVMPKRSPLA